MSRVIGKFFNKLLQIRFYYYLHTQVPSKMISKRKRNNWIKSFVQIDNKAMFQALQDEVLPNQESSEYKQKSPPKQKQDIVTPKFEIIESKILSKSKGRITASYIRLKPELNLPKLQNYQLTQVDINFLDCQRNKYILKDCHVLTEQLLAKMIIYLEKKAVKSRQTSRPKVWLKKYIDNSYKQLEDLQNYQQLINSVSYYWISRHEQLRFPLIRQLWRPKGIQPRYGRAFRARAKAKLSTRKINRFSKISGSTHIQKLKSQQQLAKFIAQRIKLMQKLKTKNLLPSFTSSHSITEEFFGKFDFSHWMDHEDQIGVDDRIWDEINKMKIQMKELRTKYSKPEQNEASEQNEGSEQSESDNQHRSEQQHKSDDKPSIKQQYKPNIKQLPNSQDKILTRNEASMNKGTQQQQLKSNGFDLNATLASFLATVVEVAISCGISYDSLFAEKQKKQKQQQQFLSSDSSSVSGNHEDGSLYQRNQVNYGKNLKIYRRDNFIYRIQDEDNDDVDYHQKIVYQANQPRNLEEYHKMQMREYYFGDDDDSEDNPNLAKDIRRSFQKFRKQNNNR